MECKLIKTVSAAYYQLSALEVSDDVCGFKTLFFSVSCQTVYKISVYEKRLKLISPSRYMKVFLFDDLAFVS